MSDELIFEWDAKNFDKLAASGRGISPDLCEQIGGLAPKFYPESRDDKSGDYWMIGPDALGRFWTIVLVRKGHNLWRPISGWPSTRRQIRIYNGDE